MAKKIPNYEPVNYSTLNKFLLGTLAMVRRKDISFEEAEAIAKLSDKVVKNNLTKIMDDNRRGNKGINDFFGDAPLLD